MNGQNTETQSEQVRNRDLVPYRPTVYDTTNYTHS